MGEPVYSDARQALPQPTGNEMNPFIIESLFWLPYIYIRKLMLAHEEFVEDLIYV